MEDDSEVDESEWSWLPARDADFLSGESGHHYSGDGGFILQAPRTNATQAREKLARLQREGWLDEHTRLLLVQLAVLNPSMEVLAVGSISFEFLASGKVSVAFLLMLVWLLI